MGHASTEHRMTLAAGAGTGPAGPAEPVPVAFLGRTSTLALQDPRRVPAPAAPRPRRPGCRPAGPSPAYYWDIESGGLDLEAPQPGRRLAAVRRRRHPPRRRHGRPARRSQRPAPRFAAVVCEDIERSAPGHVQRAETGKGTVPRRASRYSPPTSPPTSKASTPPPSWSAGSSRASRNGSGSSSRKRCWKGLHRAFPGRVEHRPRRPTGTSPTGSRTPPRPRPPRAAPRPAWSPTPAARPVVAQIFTWRTVDKLSVPAIAARLNADPAAYPPPARQPGWTEPAWPRSCANPKYTGHMVYGRTRKPATARTRPVPPDQWIWSPEPTHPAIIDRATWDAAQTIGAERGNVRDAETPTTRPRPPVHPAVPDPAPRLPAAHVRHLAHLTASRPRLHLLPLPPQPGQPPPRRRPPRPPARVVHPRRRHHGRHRRFFDQLRLRPRPRRHARRPAPRHRRRRARRRPRPAQTAPDAPSWPASTPPQTRPDHRAGTPRRPAPTPPPRPTGPHPRPLRRPVRPSAPAPKPSSTSSPPAATPGPTTPPCWTSCPTAAALFTDAPDRIRSPARPPSTSRSSTGTDQHQATIWATLTDDTPRTITALLADPRTDSDTQPAPRQPHLPVPMQCHS